MQSKSKDTLRLRKDIGEVTEVNWSAQKLRVRTRQTIEGLGSYCSLRSLDLSLNSITAIQGLETLENLLSLDLSQNLIRRIEGLKALTRLRSLNLSDNKIQQIPGRELSPLTALCTLQMARNQVADLDEIKQLATLSALSAVYFEGNPVANVRDFRLFLVFHVTGLKQIDTFAVTSEQKQAALHRYAKAKNDTFLVRENLISYRKQMSDLQDSKQDLLDQEILLNAQLQALDADFKQITASLGHSLEEKKDVERLLACTPSDQLHRKQTDMMAALSHAEILRDEAETLARKLQEARIDLQSKEKQLETIRKSLRNRSPVTRSEDFLAGEEKQVVAELREVRLQVQALDRRHGEALAEMQETMGKINALDKDIQGVKEGIAPWERTFDEETARYLPVRLTELGEEIEVWNRKLEQIRAKNVSTLSKKSEIDLQIEHIDSSLSSLKDHIRSNEVYLETGESPPIDRPTAPHYTSEDLRAWEAMRSLWRLVSGAELDMKFTTLAGTLVDWAEAFVKQLERKEREQREEVEMVKRMGEAKYTCLQAEMKDLEREIGRFKRENAISVSQPSETLASPTNSPSKDERIEQLSHKEQLLEHMNSTLLQHIQQLTEVNDTLSSQLEQLQREPLRSQLQTIKSDLETAKSQLVAVELRQKEKSRELAETTEELKATSNALSDSQKQLKEAEEELGLYLNLQHRKAANQQVEASVKALGTIFGLEMGSDVGKLAESVAEKVAEAREMAAKAALLEQERRDLTYLYEGKLAQVKDAREKLSSEERAFRKSQRAVIEKIQEEKQSLQRLCRSLRSQESRIREEVDQHKDTLSSLKLQIATANRRLTALQTESKATGRITSKDLQDSEHSFVVLRSSPDLGFVSPAPKPLHRKQVSLLSLNRCPSEEERFSTVSTDRLFRPSSNSRVRSSCSTARMEEGIEGNSKRPSSLLKIEDELQSLRQQLESFSLDIDPLPRQQTI